MDIPTSTFFTGANTQPDDEMKVLNMKENNLRHSASGPSKHLPGKPSALSIAAIAFFSLCVISTAAKAQTIPNLGAADDFAIISSQGVTNSGFTIINGNVALSPLTTITGFPPGVVIGNIHYNDTLAAQAQADANSAYNNLAGQAFLPANNKTGLDLGGMSLAPGVYHFNTSAGLTGNLTLNTGANPNAPFIFQIGSTLTTAVGSRVTVTGAGAKSDPNVFWQVGSSATLNANTTFYGTIIALASVSLGTGTTIVNGRIIALNGAVTLLGNTVSAPILAGGGTVDLFIPPGGNVSSVLGPLSPQKYQFYGDLSISNATATVQEIDARLNNLRDGSESIDTTGVGGGSDKVMSDGKESKETHEVAQVADSGKRWGFFASGNAGFFRANNHDVNIRGAKSSTAGTVAGVDAKVGEHVVLGAFFAYDNADVTLGNDGSHARVQSYTGGLYGAWHQDNFYLNGLVDYTRNNYSSGRNITAPGFSDTATGGTHGHQYTANLDGGYDWHVTPRLTMGPIAGLQYDHLDVNGFSESGAGLGDLAVGIQSMNSLQSRVGGRMNYHIHTTENVAFAAEVHAAWQHEFLNDSRGINASFIGSGLAPFTVRTSPPERDAAVVGLGLNLTFHQRFTFFTGYEVQFWQKSYFEQRVSAGGRISF